MAGDGDRVPNLSFAATIDDGVVVVANNKPSPPPPAETDEVAAKLVPTGIIDAEVDDSVIGIAVLPPPLPPTTVVAFLGVEGNGIIVEDDDGNIAGGFKQNAPSETSVQCKSCLVVFVGADLMELATCCASLVKFGVSEVLLVVSCCSRCWLVLCKLVDFPGPADA